MLCFLFKVGQQLLNLDSSVMGRCLQDGCSVLVRMDFSNYSWGSALCAKLRWEHLNLHFRALEQCLRDRCSFFCAMEFSASALCSRLGPRLLCVHAIVIGRCLLV